MLTAAYNYNLGGGNYNIEMSLQLLVVMRNVSPLVLDDLIVIIEHKRSNISVYV